MIKSHILVARSFVGGRKVEARKKKKRKLALKLAKKNIRVA